MKLSKIKTGQKAVITSVDASDISSQRLIEIGFSVDSEVEVLIKGMNPNLTAYRVKNTIIALRDKTADKINVLLKSGGIDDR